MTTSPKILVIGLGGIGGTVSSYLLQSGYNVTGVTTNAQVLAALNDNGFQIESHTGKSWGVRGPVFESIPSHERFDFILLATQPTQAEKAATSAFPYLSEHGALVCFQNGLLEEKLASQFGDQRVVGAVVAWGASSPKPGQYLRTSAGGFTLGRYSGPADDQVRRLSKVLEVIGEVTVTDNLAGSRWSKLAINCAVSSLGAISGQPLGKLLKNRKARRLALEIMTEVVLVARNEQVQLKKISGTIDLEWIALEKRREQYNIQASIVLKHLVMLAVGFRFRKLRSSMLYALEKGRKPPVDFLNGEVVSRGKAAGVNVSVNEAVQSFVHSIAKKEKCSSMATLFELFAATR
ncbi:MAG: 2-dehydropantoate 2-reductase [Myxococcota bacterium]|nr:2-dehydropantoate 2-reductase [Myxococcota bacterium]